MKIFFLGIKNGIAFGDKAHLVQVAVANLDISKESEIETPLDITWFYVCLNFKAAY